MLRTRLSPGLMALTALGLAVAPSAVRGQGQVLDYSLTHAGYARHYILYVPSGYTPGNSTPLVVNLHGGGHSGFIQMTLVSKMNPIAEREGFLVAYPDAISGQWGGPGANDPYDDFGFINAMIAEVSSGYSVDASRVYATGFSMGAMMAYNLSVKFPYTFAAIAPVAGVRPYWPGTQIQTPIGVPETPSRPFPLLHIAGTADPQVPYDGGVSPTNGWTWPAAEQVVGGYAANNGCGGTPSVVDLPDIDPTDGCTVQLLTYGNCGTYLDTAGNARPAEVLLYKVVNGGHNWPGDSTFGPNWWNFPLNRDISASEVIWSFFSRHAVAPGTSLGDLDYDGDVDLSDFAVFQGCFNRPPAQASGCWDANLDEDAALDVDLDDFSIFQACFNGPNQRPACQ